jgi:hypothetical protein
MKTSLVAISLLIGVVCCASLALANPAMLPKHPGYPAGSAVSPVTGQPLANDPGQTNATGEKASLEAAAAEDAHVTQHLTNPEDQRILEKPGAGLLPKVQGPQIKIEPPVKEATRMK